MSQQMLFLLTRTPLHVGAAAPDGVIDAPCLRERHSGLPMIRGSTLKGVLAQPWWDAKQQARSQAGLRLFGGMTEGGPKAGLLQITDARLLAFPVRSARGGFAWISSPYALRRFARDGGMPEEFLPSTVLRDDQAWFARSGPLPLTLGGEVRVVLEDYSFTNCGELPTGPRVQEGSPKPATAGLRQSLGELMRGLVSMDCVWQEASSRLVLVTDHILSFFTRTASDIASHARVDEQTGVAAIRDAFLQENVPAETLFYATLRLHPRPGSEELTPPDADWDSLRAKLHQRVFQFGADASTGLGFCGVELRPTAAPSTDV
jgi:CRISPR-associated protein Cmr4